MTTPPTLDELIARAEGAMANLHGDFEADIELRLQRLLEIFRDRWQPLASREAGAQELRRINHDIKGEAGTFGYDLLGHIADVFGEYLRGTPLAEQREDVLARYVVALQETWSARVRGDGGEDGRRLRERLTRLKSR